MIFRARDSAECWHLVRSLEKALALEEDVAVVAARSYYGDETSLFVWSYYDAGWQDGYGVGEKRGMHAAFDLVDRGRKTPRVLRERAAHRQKRRKKAR